MSLVGALFRAGLLSMGPLTLLRIAWRVRSHGFRPSGIAAVAAIRFPEQVAIRDDDGSLTYRELDARVNRLAGVLREQHDVGPERAVGILCRNHRGFVEALLATSTLSADAILLNTEFPAPQLAQVLRDQPFACVVHDPEFRPLFVEAGYAGPRIVVGDLLPISAPPVLSRRRGKIVILTSGTTGVPKGAARNPGFRALKGPLTTLLERIPLRTRLTMSVAPPLFHGFGLAYLVLALLLGATLVLRRRFDPSTVLADAVQHDVNVLVAVPTMLRRLLEVPCRPVLPSVVAVLSAGSPLGADLGTRLLAGFGPVLYNLYGSSETGFGAIATPADLAKAPGTVGHPPDGTEIRLLGPDDRPVATGEIGRVFVASGLVFAGYVGGGNKDRVDGFTCSGDVGRFDTDGRLFIEGRADDMIVSGGENVFPLEVEEVLASHPGVAEVAVTGVTDDAWGQRLEAFVVRRDGEVLDDDTLRGFLKERIARYKVPRRFVFLPELPRTATGKILKRELHT